ncbi:MULTISPECIES: hydrogenase/urease nickel incorporation protein HypA [unclassified Helicobacter]|uniref:hydrogenase/urease nickel incorporation protein HypA n=1 Tax=unclassified Helicobacter TaxID=2593540 RepID=UPI000CF05FD7|nr:MULTISPECIES: hydrogenase/urease nickel incorporation protein HypA [unclassified Helicobacter]
MHEYSVVASLIDLCEENAKANNAQKVAKVVVSIGERSGMDKSLFISAFETFREESSFCKNALLEIKEERVKLECQKCGEIFQPNGIAYGECIKCNSNALKMIEGKEMYLVSLELLQEETEE